MIKYCKILDNETGLVQLGVGCSEDYYQEIGMTQHDVEQSEKDYQWYLTEKCPHYTEEEKTAMREAEFKSTFFYINSFGWYRKHPKGYQSAVESINSAYNSFAEMQKLGLAENFPANTLIFYQQPDFTKAEQCTEEWLVEHQIFNQAMTPQQFGQFYIGFIQAWNTQEHNNIGGTL